MIVFDIFYIAHDQKWLIPMIKDALGTTTAPINLFLTPWVRHSDILESLRKKKKTKLTNCKTINSFRANSFYNRAPQHG